jgi:hypothetical protein
LGSRSQPPAQHAAKFLAVGAANLHMPQHFELHVSPEFINLDVKKKCQGLTKKIEANLSDTVACSTIDPKNWRTLLSFAIEESVVKFSNCSVLLVAIFFFLIGMNGGEVAPPLILSSFRNHINPRKHNYVRSTISYPFGDQGVRCCLRYPSVPYLDNDIHTSQIISQQFFSLRNVPRVPVVESSKSAHNLNI